MQPAYRVGRDASATQPRRREQVIRIVFTIIMTITGRMTKLVLVIKCRRTSCTRSGLKVQWKLSWRSTPTSSCTPAVSTRFTSISALMPSVRTPSAQRLNVQLQKTNLARGVVAGYHAVRIIGWGQVGKSNLLLSFAIPRQKKSPIE